MPMVKRFISGKSIEKRLSKAPLSDNWRKSIEREAQMIFKTAEVLLSSSRQGDHFIFPGLGMRPLFEALRGLNELHGRLPRRNIVYIVTPKAKLDLPILSLRHIPRLKKLLEKKVQPGDGVYHLVDFTVLGRTFLPLRIAIKRLNPKAKVKAVNGSLLDSSMDGILYSDSMPRPTKKTRMGKIIPSDNAHDRIAYLYFQKLLQDHLKRKRDQD